MYEELIVYGSKKFIDVVGSFIVEILVGKIFIMVEFIVLVGYG